MKNLFVLFFFLPAISFAQEFTPERTISVEESHVVFANLFDDLSKSDNDYMYSDELEEYSFYLLKADTAQYGFIIDKKLDRSTLVVKNDSGLKVYYASLQFEEGVAVFEFYIGNGKISFASKKDYGSQIHALIGETRAFFFETAEYADLK